MNDQNFKERRNYNRILQNSIVIINDTEGFLIDLSEDGLGISVARRPSEQVIKIKLILEGEEFLLSGEIIWEGWNKKYSEFIDIGIQLMDPPEGYVNFVRDLSNNT